VGLLGIIVPELDGADVLFVVAAEQHHHGHQELAGENRQRDAAGQSGFDRLVCALEVGVCELSEDNGVPRGPGLAGQALVIGEQRVFADGLELRILFAAKTAAELQACARSVGHPQFNDAYECLHRDAPVATPLSASAI
jgi:hypothetical protein